MTFISWMQRFMHCTGERWLLPAMSPRARGEARDVAGSAAVGELGGVVSWDLRSWGCESPAVQVFLAR